jgi:hypothetical protein
VTVESVRTALAVWKLGAIPCVFFAVAGSFYAINKFEPFLVMGGIFIVSGFLAAACCWLKTIPAWLIYWVKLRG